MSSRMWTDDKLTQAVASSQSVAGVLRQLGMQHTGGENHRVINRSIDRLALDTSHWPNPRQRSAPITKHAVTRPLTDYLVLNGPYINTSRLKILLWRAGLKPQHCERCELSEWFGKELTLHLDHVNGNRRDNRLSNLCILCPNCHDITETYARPKHLSGIRRSRTAIIQGPSTRPSYKRAPVFHPCPNCGRPIRRKSRLCMSCYNGGNKQSKIIWPSVAELIETLRTQSCRSVAQSLGVSDQGLMQHLRHHGHQGFTMRQLRLSTIAA